MLNYYKSFFIGLSILVAIIILVLGVGTVFVHSSLSLLPFEDSKISWVPELDPKKSIDNTEINITEQSEIISYEFTLDAKEIFPRAEYKLNFFDSGSSQNLVDLSRFKGVSFKIRCNPEYVLKSILYTFDERITKLADPETHRASTHFFSCRENWTSIVIPFSSFTTPNWWLDANELSVANKHFSLEKVLGFSITSTAKGERNIPIRVQVDSLVLIRESWVSLYIAIFVSFLCSAFFTFWSFREYHLVLTEVVKANVDRTRPIVAYKTLSLSTQKDKEKEKIFQFIAKEYTRSDMKIELAVSELGISRSRINDVLKNELGLTFTGYLNKLRVTEGARILQEDESANVSAIAYSLGYNNVSYFNKLFKTEYGCSPTAFKSLYKNSVNTESSDQD